MSKIMFYFFFPLFITQNLRRGRVERAEDGWAAHIGDEVRIFSELLSFNSLVGSKSHWLYNFSDAHVNSVGHTFFSLPSTRCTWTLLTSGMPLKQFTWYFRRVHFQSFSFNQSQTFTTESTNVKEVFKSISNNLYWLVFLNNFADATLFSMFFF